MEKDRAGQTCGEQRSAKDGTVSGVGSRGGRCVCSPWLGGLRDSTARGGTQGGALGAGKRAALSETGTQDIQMPGHSFV